MNGINSGTILINVSDWRLPVFEVKYSVLPQLGNRLVLHGHHYVGYFADIARRIKGANAILLGNRGASLTGKSWSEHFISASRTECEVQLVGGDFPVPDKWKVTATQRAMRAGKAQHLFYWPIRVATFVSNVASVKPVDRSLTCSDVQCLVNSVQTMSMHGPGIVSLSRGSSQGWLLGNSAVCQAKNNAALLAGASELPLGWSIVTFGDYIRGIFHHVYANSDPFSFTRSVLYRMTRESETESVIHEVSRGRMRNPYGLSPIATKLFGTSFVDQGIRQTEDYYRARGWSAHSLDIRSGRLLAKNSSGKVWPGQKVFGDTLHRREISRLMCAELAEQNSKTQ